MISCWPDPKETDHALIFELGAAGDWSRREGFIRAAYWRSRSRLSNNGLNGLLNDETWPHLLQEHLNHQGARAQVVNLGLSGANIHDVVTLIKATRRMAMDYALVVTAYNNHPLLRVERRFTFARKLDFYLHNISVFHVLVKEKLARLQSQPLDLR